MEQIASHDNASQERLEGVDRGCLTTEPSSLQRLFLRRGSWMSCDRAVLLTTHSRKDYKRSVKLQCVLNSDSASGNPRSGDGDTTAHPSTTSMPSYAIAFDRNEGLSHSEQ